MARTPFPDFDKTLLSLSRSGGAASGRLTPLVRRWVLRILVPLGGQRAFIERDGFSHDGLAEALGLLHLAHETDPFPGRAARAALRQLHLKAEKARVAHRLPPLLAANVRRLGGLVGLDPAARLILGFVVMLKSDPILNPAADLLGQLTTLKAIQALAVILGLTEAGVRAALAGDAPLCRSGLLQADRNGSYTLDMKFNLLSEAFADAMISDDGDAVGLLQTAVRPAAPGTLDRDDYAHLAPQCATLEAYLRVAVSSRRSGVNVLLHGQPGNGKSELARLTAKSLGLSLMEIVAEDSDGDPIDGERRLRAYRAAQSMFARRRALILFDEVEDVFGSGRGLPLRPSIGQAHKAWINRMLEENPVPAFWLTNAVRHLDPAFIRRFDMVIEVPVPPKPQRRKIIASACEGLIDAESAEQLASHTGITPAVVTRAAAVARAVASQPGLPETPSAMMVRLIGSTLVAQGEAPLESHRAETTGFYDPAFISADCELAPVAEGLARSRTGRLCLYGPPGTGKTAYGRWLADRLDKPLLVKRASDLLSMFVGGTERALADAFREAADDGAILLIDEVDSFLQDRRGAHRSWEVTQVNELLTQMEMFDGIFIATTNLMHGIDQAALRRFDIKVKFGYLRPDQAAALLARHCAAAGIAAPVRDDLQRLARLDGLTPGDFALLARRQRFQPASSASDWLDALESECALKNTGARRIGFV